MDHRLINTDFLKASSFLYRTSNRAKLLYLLMIVYADDKGFVDETDSIIELLRLNDKENNIDDGMLLLKNDYVSAVQELIQKGLIYEFKNKHQDSIYLIRHWYIHNKFTTKTKTRYFNLYNQVEISAGEYVMKTITLGNPLKESKGKESKVKENKVNENKILLNLSYLSNSTISRDTHEGLDVDEEKLNQLLNEASMPDAKKGL